MAKGVQESVPEHWTSDIFFITDQVEKRNLEIQYCPTDDMIGDYYTKPLQGGKFLKFRKLILGEVDNGDQGDQDQAGEQENQGIRKLDVKRERKGWEKNSCPRTTMVW
jgi:hypothetical protein